MEQFYTGTFPFVIIWWYVLLQGNAQYQDMVCENLGSRHSRKMTQPGPECDMSERNWCTVKTASYPEERIMEVILDNRGIMKRLFGDHREARFLQHDINNIFDTPEYPLPPLKPRRVKSNTRHSKEVSTPELVNGRFPESKILANSRDGKKIDGGKPEIMKVTGTSVSITVRKETKTRDEMTTENEIETTNLSTTSTTPSEPDDILINSNSSSSIDSNDNSSTTDNQIRRTVTTTTEMDYVTEESVSFDDDHNDIMSTLGMDESFVTEPTLSTERQKEGPEEHISENSENISTPRPSEAEVEKVISEIESSQKSDNEGASSSRRRDSEKQKYKAKGPLTPPTLALDSGDDLSYNSKTSEPPKPTKLQPLNEPQLETTEAKKIVEKTDKNDTSTESLKGRVEFPASYTSAPPSWNSSPSYRPKPKPQAYPHQQQYQQQHRYQAQQNPHYQRRPVNSVPLRERTDLPQAANGENKFKRPSERPNRPNSRLPAHMEKFPACNSTTELIAPTWAKNLQGKNLIVVNVGSFMQHLHIELCDKDSLFRKRFCQRGCRCEQQFRMQKLLVIDPDDECRGIFSDWFRFPSCCTCVCYAASLQMRGSNRHSRIFEEDEEEYYEDDEDDPYYYGDDLDDPLIRHYYGLDEEEPEEDWQDIEAEASSNQPTYTSFTDIDSIGRSLIVDRPLRTDREETDKHRWWSINPNSLGTRGTPVSKHLVEANRLRNSSNALNFMRDKKSRLLKGFNRTTVNIPPQIRPRRIPPRRFNSAPPYAFPWYNSPSVSIWPSLAMQANFPYSSRSYNSFSSRKIPSDIPNFSNKQVVTPPSSKIFRSTLGTLNVATPPFYNWNKNPRLLENSSLRKGSEKDSRVYRRIPRQAGSGQ